MVMSRTRMIPCAPPKVGLSQSERNSSRAISQHRGADHQARHGGGEDHERHGGPEDPANAEAGLGRGEQRGDVRAHREEGHVAQVEQPGEPHHDVQPQRHEQEDAGDINELAEERPKYLGQQAKDEQEPSEDRQPEESTGPVGQGLQPRAGRPATLPRQERMDAERHRCDRDRSRDAQRAARLVEEVGQRRGPDPQLRLDPPEHLHDEGLQHRYREHPHGDDQHGPAPPLAQQVERPGHSAEHGVEGEDQHQAGAEVQPEGEQPGRLPYELRRDVEQDPADVEGGDQRHEHRHDDAAQQPGEQPAGDVAPAGPRSGEPLEDRRRPPGEVADQQRDGHQQQRAERHPAEQRSLGERLDHAVGRHERGGEPAHKAEPDRSPEINLPGREQVARCGDGHLDGDGRLRHRYARSSLTRSPRMPVGRKISTSTSARNATTSLSWWAEGMPSPTSTMLGPNDSTEPSSRPPTTAPGMLPMPPRTAAVNALMPGRNPLKKCTFWNTSPNRKPAAPARAPPIAKTLAIVRSTLSPISRAISGSSATARMALPALVFSTYRYRPAIISSAATITSRCTLRIRNPRKVKAPLRALTDG